MSVYSEFNHVNDFCCAAFVVNFVHNIVFHRRYPQNLMFRCVSVGTNTNSACLLIHIERVYLLSAGPRVIRAPLQYVPQYGLREHYRGNFCRRLPSTPESERDGLKIGRVIFCGLFKIR